jgi:tetratricopeptide (TPR) repeat protein
VRVPMIVTVPPAWAALGVNLLDRVQAGLLPISDGCARARQASERGLEIDPREAHAHNSLALIRMICDDDLAEAARQLERGFAIDPTRSHLLASSGSLLLAMGRAEASLPIREYQVRVDPVNVNSLYNLALIQLIVGRVDEAIANFRTALSLSPDNGGAHYGSALRYS